MFIWKISGGALAGKLLEFMNEMRLVIKTALQGESRQMLKLIFAEQIKNILETNDSTECLRRQTNQSLKFAFKLATTYSYIVH